MFIKNKVMGIFNINNKITISELKQLGFRLGYWGSPDYYTERKLTSIHSRNHTTPHWNPCRKFYEYYNDDIKALIYYFPKKFDAYVNWKYIGVLKPDLLRNGVIVIQSDTGAFDSEIYQVSDMSIFEYAIGRAQQLYDTWYNNLFEEEE